MTKGLPRQTMNKRLNDSSRKVYGHVNGVPMILDIPVRVYQTCDRNDVLASPIGKSHSIAVDGSTWVYMHRTEDKTDARPPGFQELDAEQFKVVNAAYQRKRISVRTGINNFRSGKN